MRPTHRRMGASRRSPDASHAGLVLVWSWWWLGRGTWASGRQAMFRAPAVEPPKPLNRCPSTAAWSRTAARADPQRSGAAVECPRVPWTFYARHGQALSDHGRDLTGGRVTCGGGRARSRFGRCRGALVRYHGAAKLWIPARHLDHSGQLLCDGPSTGRHHGGGLAIRYAWMSRRVGTAASWPRLRYARLYQ